MYKNHKKHARFEVIFFNVTENVVFEVLQNAPRVGQFTDT